MNEDWGIAPPPFQPEQALPGLQRSLRELGLVERQGVFQRGSQAIAKVAVDGAMLAAARVMRPSRTGPEWLGKTLRSAADVRDFVADLKRHLAQWSDRDD